MPFNRLSQALNAEVATIDGRGSSKRHEVVIVDVVPPRDGHGPRYLLQGEGGGRAFRLRTGGRAFHQRDL